MDRLEMAASEVLSPAARKLLSAGSLATPLLHQPDATRGGSRGAGDAGAVVSAAGSAAGELSVEAYMELSGPNDAIVPVAAIPSATAATAATAATTSAGAAAAGASASDGSLSATPQLSASELAAFPAGKLDETRQPLDLSHTTSWSRRLGEVSTPELLHTLAANAVAPFILCSALRPALAPTAAEEPYGHIINVSALEGKLAVGKKGAGHPHTNMSKAALNMLTLTSASSLFQERILVNAVDRLDTGWVTDMAPGGVGAVAATHATHVGPPLDAVDGAARVLDPIFSHAKAPRTWLVRGKFWKDYAVSNRVGAIGGGGGGGGAARRGAPLGLPTPADEKQRGLRLSRHVRFSIRFFGRADGRHATRATARRGAFACRLSCSIVQGGVVAKNIPMLALYSKSTLNAASTKTLSSTLKAL